jgi:NADH-quinone oxidoreductase subunit N
MDQIPNTAPLAASLAHMTPEIFLGLGSLALLMLGVFRGDRALSLISMASVLLLGVAGALVAVGPETAQVFNGTIVIDPFSTLMKYLVLIGSAVAIIMSIDFLKAEKIGRFEFPILIVLAALGMMIMISANDLIVLYMGLELQSLSLYVLASFNRDSLRSSESGLKYFVLGALSSGILLYGASLIYGFAGSTNFDAIAALTSQGLDNKSHMGIIFGLTFLLAGLAFKISAVPFHMWTPDVYEGSPTPVTAFFAAAPKIAAMALIVRVTIGAFPLGPDGTAPWQQIVVFLAIASMVLGAFSGIGQTNIKRLMAYSSIGHMGYALVGLVAGTTEGVRGVIVYMIIYLVTLVGVFVCILSMRRKEGMVEKISDLAGLSRSQPFVAATLMVLMFSLAGIPPLAGFIGKWYVFLPAVEAGFAWLAIIGVVASVVSAVYYLNVIKVIYLDEPGVPFVSSMSLSLKGLLTLSGLFTVLFMLVARFPLEWANVAAQSVVP